MNKTNARAARINPQEGANKEEIAPAVQEVDVLRGPAMLQLLSMNRKLIAVKDDRIQTEYVIAQIRAWFKEYGYSERS